MGATILEFWNIYGAIITGGAVILSAIAGFLFIVSNRRLGRRRATLDLILHIESDGDLIEARKKFVEVKNGQTKASHWGSPAQKNSEEAAAIKTVLNIHELVAVSIHEGVIDERVFRRWFNRGYIDDYNSMDGFIRAIRERSKFDKTFREFQDLATRWADDKSWYAEPGWFKRKWWALAKCWRA